MRTRIDLTGQKFNLLTIIKLAENKEHKNGYYWVCLCDCGNETIVRGDAIKHGRIKSCGCLGSTNLIGQKFNLLTVIEDTGKRASGRHHGEKIWKCLCDCGNFNELATSRLTLSSTKSCGCLQRRRKDKSPNWRGFGQISADVWYRINSEAQGRKIDFSLTIEEAWDQFEKQNGICSLSGLKLKFPEKSKEKSKTASLDRIDSSKGYTKDNIQWVHKDINWMKNRFDQNYFIEMCKRIANYNKKKKCL